MLWRPFPYGKMILLLQNILQHAMGDFVKHCFVFMKAGDSPVSLQNILSQTSGQQIEFTQFFFPYSSAIFDLSLLAFSLYSISLFAPQVFLPILLIPLRAYPVSWYLSLVTEVFHTFDIQ